MRLLVIDNFDSFTYNLVQYFGQLGVDQEVRRNNDLTPDQARALNPDAIVISPGPCDPDRLPTRRRADHGPRSQR